MSSDFLLTKPKSYNMCISFLCQEYIVYRINWIVCVVLAAFGSEDAAHALECASVWFIRLGQLYKSDAAVVLGRNEGQDLYSSWQSLMGQDKQWYNTLAPTGTSSTSSSTFWLFNLQSVLLLINLFFSSRIWKVCIIISQAQQQYNCSDYPSRIFILPKSVLLRLSAPCSSDFSASSEFSASSDFSASSRPKHWQSPDPAASALCN